VAVEGHESARDAARQPAVQAGPDLATPWDYGGQGLPAAIGNRAFGAVVGGAAPRAAIGGHAAAADTSEDRTLSRHLARAVLRREPWPARVLARDAKTGTPERKREADRLKAEMPKLERVSAATGDARDDLKSFASEGLAKVDRIAGFFGMAAKLYNTAYQSHSKIVAEDNKAAADAKATRDAIIGVIIGVASAYTSVPLLEAMALRKLLVETGGELAELGASKVKEAAEGEQAPPAPDKLTPELMELEQSKELIKLYRGLAALQAGEDVGAISSACDKVIIEIERYDEGRNKFPAAKLDGFIAALVRKEPVANSTKEKVTAASKDLDAKLRDVEKRMAINDPQEILKDIWTRWLAAGNEPGAKAWAELERLGLQRSYGFLQPITQEGGGAEKAAAARALRGKVGTAATDLAPAGEVLVDGAAWPANARYGATIPAGTTIRVTGIKGMPDANPWGGPPSEVETFATLIVDWDELPGGAAPEEQAEPVSR
jgi:hypothetical protein